MKSQLLPKNLPRQYQLWLNKIYLLMAACLVWFFPLTAWSQPTELGLWTGVNLQKSFKQSFTLHLNGQTRFSENISVMRAYLGEVGIEYKLNKHWETIVYYRFIGRRKWDEEAYQHYYHPNHRFYADVSYDHKIWKFKFDYRLRYQHQFKDDATGIDPGSSYVRSRFELAYPNKSRFTPYVSTDVFYQVGEGLNQMRNKMGLEIAINRYNQINLYGFTDYQLVGRQKNHFTLGFMYKVKF